MDKASQGTRLTRAQVAEFIGVTPMTVARWDNEGEGPPRDAQTGTYDLAKLGVWWRDELVFKTGRGGSLPYMPDHKRLRRAIGLPSTPTVTLPGLEVELDPETKDEADRRLAVAKADKQEMDNRERAADLIPASLVTTAWTEIVARVKVKLTKIPSALAPICYGKRDAFEVQEVLESGIREALDELSENWQDGAE